MPEYQVHIRAEYENVLPVEADSPADAIGQINWEEVASMMHKASGNWEVVTIMDGEDEYCGLCGADFHHGSSEMLIEGIEKLTCGACGKTIRRYA